MLKSLEKERRRTKDLLMMKNDIKRAEDGQIEISHGERFSRFYKRYVKDNEKFGDEDNYKKELTMFDKSQYIQTARYLQVDKNKLRKQFKRNCHEEHKDKHSHDDEQGDGKVNSDDEYNFKRYTTSVPVDIRSKKFDPRGIENDKNYEVDLNFMTHRQVGRKRRPLFLKKV